MSACRSWEHPPISHRLDRRAVSRLRLPCVRGKVDLLKGGLWRGSMRNVFAALALVAVTLPIAAVPASADTGPVISGGETQPVYDYAKAVREQVYVETPVD